MAELRVSTGGGGATPGEARLAAFAARRAAIEDRDDPGKLFINVDRNVRPTP